MPTEQSEVLDASPTLGRGHKRGREDEICGESVQSTVIKAEADSGKVSPHETCYQKASLEQICEQAESPDLTIDTPDLPPPSRAVDIPPTREQCYHRGAADAFHALVSDGSDTSQCSGSPRSVDCVPSSTRPTLTAHGLEKIPTVVEHSITDNSSRSTQYQAPPFFRGDEQTQLRGNGGALANEHHRCEREASKGGSTTEAISEPSGVREGGWGELGSKSDESGGSDEEEWDLTEDMPSDVEAAFDIICEGYKLNKPAASELGACEPESLPSRGVQSSEGRELRSIVA
mmetsp:Transcript_28924/g.35147  ORF Transcript_28924/g.35147 Transcript_28924/m.35147 type:complete len:288 (+) Transcript_28924:324-1187(+)